MSLASAAAMVALETKKVRLFFDQSSDEQLLVLAEVLPPSNSKEQSLFCFSTYKHEDLFLERVIAANLTVPQTSQVAGIVLLTVADPSRSKNWVELELNEQELHHLGFEDKVAEAAFVSETTNESAGLLLPHCDDGIEQLHDFLIHAPSAFAMLSGSEHRFTFINERYLDLLGESSAENVLTKPVRQVLPELEGQGFFQLLDGVYETGAAHIGIEKLAHMRRKDSPHFEDRYFDFIYHP